MLRLITLGRIELTDASGRPVDSIISRPKRLALLAYLAAGGPGSLRSRDQVLALFWPETTQAKARQSLNQALHVLRRELGHGVILSVGNDQVGLAPGTVWCDAVAVRDAVRSGDHRSAQTHYRGEFLPGFFLSGAPDFEKWLDGERATLRRMASSSAWKLAEEAAAAGDVETAAQAAARSAELSLREEAAVRRAIELLDSLGERARALDLYRELESDLAEDLGTRPAPETQEVVARVRAREAPEDVARAAAGPPLEAPRRSQGEGPPRAGPDDGGSPPVVPPVRPRAERAPASVPAQEVAPARARSPAQARRRAALLVLPLLAVGVALALLLTRPAPRPASGTTLEPHLLIEPFDAYAGDERLTDIAGAITAALAARLADVDALEVLLVEQGSAPSADSAALALDAPPTSARAWFILRGHVLRDGNRMRAYVSLIDRASGNVIASANIQRLTSDPVGFVEDATDDAATFARAAVGRELRERAWRMSTADVEAWRLLERAESDRLAANQLIRRDAMTAADAAFAQADSLLARAAEREPEWVPPIVMRAQVAYERMWVAMLPPTMDFGRARGFMADGAEHAARALELDSTDARAQELNGLLVYWDLLLTSPLPDSALDVLARAETHFRSAVERDARRAVAWSTLSALLQTTGRFEEAYYAAQQAYDADAFLDAPEDILVKLFTGAFESGDDEAARRWCAEIRERFAGNSYGTLCALTMLAWSDTATATRDALALLQSTPLRADDPFRLRIELALARILARGGETDRALSIVHRVREDASWNDELLTHEAAVRLALGQADSASALLRQFIDAKPTLRQGVIESRRFMELRE